MEATEMIRAGMPLRRGWGMSIFWHKEGEEVAFGGSYSSPHYPWEGHQEDRARLFTVVHCGRVRDNKLRECQTGYKEKFFFPMRAARQWSRLPGYIVRSSSLEVFNTQIDKALSNITGIHSWPSFEKEVGIEISWGPIWPEYLMTLWNGYVGAGYSLCVSHLGEWIDGKICHSTHTECQMVFQKLPQMLLKGNTRWWYFRFWKEASW